MQNASHFGCRSDAGLAPDMPGSLQSFAPCARNCSASMVLPEPGPPTSSVVRPRGKPPPVISSKPAMPVGALVGTFTRGDRTDFILPPVVIIINFLLRGSAGRRLGSRCCCGALEGGAIHRQADR